MAKYTVTYELTAVFEIDAPDDDAVNEWEAKVGEKDFIIFIPSPPAHQLGIVAGTVKMIDDVEINSEEW